MRLRMIQAIALLFVASSALAGPADHALTLRLPFGGNADDPDSRMQVDVFNIRQALDNIQKGNSVQTIVVDPDAMNAASGDRSMPEVNTDDPNLNGRVANYNVQFPADRNLHPVDANTLYINQIRPDGTATYTLPPAQPAGSGTTARTRAGQ